MKDDVMLLLLLAYAGGVLTIVSPCILPVLPFVFARADRPFPRSGLPMLVGLALTFMAVATLAAVGGGWAVRANEAGRGAALALLAVSGLVLLFPALSERLTRPLVRLGDRMSRSLDDRDAARQPILPSLLLGMATGLLWAPCAGPILGLILTGAALRGANAMTSLLLLAYAAGAATSLALALLVGGRVFGAMKRSLHAGEWIRRALGVAVLAGVCAIALGLDTGLLARASQAGTASLEQSLLDRLRPGGVATAAPAADAIDLPNEGPAPSLDGATAWLNSPPLTMPALRGKVVLIDFWTYSCINCLRALPYVKAWAAKYKDAGLVVIGVHTPEFAFEKNVDNIRQAMAKQGVTYPVAVDGDYAIWRAYRNQYWPAHYFIDARGDIRHHHFGEGGYAESERVIQQLLAEAGHPVTGGTVAVAGKGAEAAPDGGDIDSPETYLGHARAQGFASPGGAVIGVPHAYLPVALRPNQWDLSGEWTVDEEHATLDKADGGIGYRFHARDLHLVMGPAADGTPVRFRVTLDGRPPGDDHGADTDANGYGLVSAQRLYQLVRQRGKVDDRAFEIRFLDPGVQAFAFTFG